MRPVGYVMSELEGHWEGLPNQELPLYKSFTHRHAIISALLHVTPLPSSNDICPEYSHEMKGKDETKEMHGHLEAKRRGAGRTKQLLLASQLPSHWLYLPASFSKRTEMCPGGLPHFLANTPGQLFGASALGFLNCKNACCIGCR